MKHIPGKNQTEETINLRKNSFSNADSGYGENQESSGMQPSLMDMPDTAQTDISQPVHELPPAPEYSQEPVPEQYQEQYSQEQYPQTQSQAIDYRTQMDEIESLIESVIDEKWQGVVANVGDLNVWKEKTRTDIVSIKQELIRVQSRFENLERAILGKISEYDKNVVNIGAELKAMEKVFEKIMQPLTSNIKELSRLTTHLKAKK